VNVQTPVSISISTGASSYAKNTNVTINVTITPGTAQGSIQVHQDGSATGNSVTVTGGSMTIVWNSPNNTNAPNPHTITVVYTSSSGTFESPVTSNTLSITLT
jgi:hypothetical protein